MKNKSILKMLGKWLKYRRGVLLYFLFFIAMIFVVYALYLLPLAAAGYVALLGTAGALLLGGVDFVRFAARHTDLEKLAGRFPTGVLPPARNILEGDYAAIVQALEEERGRLADEAKRRRRADEEYYMLWAHQIKTPIAAMRLLLQTVESSGSTKEHAAMEQELFRIEQYVDMVLQYLRLGSMEGDLMLEEQQVETLVKKALKACAPLFIYKRLPVEVGTVTGSVVTDEKWMVFVLEQLLTNAQKYTATGKVSIYSEGTALVVQDTGIGIRAADLPRVFERGFTGRNGRMGAGSTGIGLYLCKEITGRLGVGLSITSTPGQGTAVRLDFAQSRLELE